MCNFFSAVAKLHPLGAIEVVHTLGEPGENSHRAIMAKYGLFEDDHSVAKVMYDIETEELRVFDKRWWCADPNNKATIIGKMKQILQWRQQ